MVLRLARLPQDQEATIRISTVNELFSQESSFLNLLGVLKGLQKEKKKHYNDD